MAIICPQPGLTGMIDLTPSRCATKRIGGVNKRVFIGSLSELAGFTRNTEGEILTITMKTGKKMYSLTGKKLKNAHNTEIKQSENGTLFTQSVTYVAYFDTQAEKEAIEKLAKLDDAFIIVQNNYGRVEAFGLVGDGGIMGEGLSISAGNYGVEAAADGATAMPLTFTGDEAKLPVYTNLGADLTAELVYLEGLKTPAA